MTADLGIRITCLLLSAFVGGMALVRAGRRTDLYRWTLLALAGYALAAVFGQVTLINEPVTVRTAASLVASTLGAWWAGLVIVKKPPPTKGKGQD